MEGEAQKVFSVRLTNAEARALREVARKENRTVSNQLRVFLLESIRRRGVSIRENSDVPEYRKTGQ